MPLSDARTDAKSEQKGLTLSGPLKPGLLSPINAR